MIELLAVIIFWSLLLMFSDHTALCLKANFLNTESHNFIGVSLHAVRDGRQSASTEILMMQVMLPPGVVKTGQSR
jgi:hypothetical protein